MKEYVEPTTGRSDLLSPASVGILYRASLQSDDPVAGLITIAAISPWDAVAVANAPIEDLDRKAGTLQLVGPLGFRTPVALGFEAAGVLDLVIGPRRAGCVLVDAGGFMLKDDQDTHDYLRELLGIIDGRTLDLDWTLRLIRESIFAEMVDYGVPLHIAEAQAGLGLGNPDDRLDQRAAAEWWAYRMGVAPPRAFSLLEHVGTRRSRMPRHGGSAEGTGQ
jgi:hypothetical protein